MIHTGGNTNTAGALEAVLNYLLAPEHHGRDSARKVVVLLTDGLSNQNPYQTIQKALKLKSYGVEIFVVSMEIDVDEAELTSIASEPSETHVIVQSFLNGPTHLIDFTVYGICNLPIPTPAPPGEYICLSFPGDMFIQYNVHAICHNVQNINTIYFLLECQVIKHESEHQL